MHMAAGGTGDATACCYHPHGADGVCSMAFPSPRGGTSSFATAFSPPPLDAAQHLDVLDYLSDEGGWPVVPGTFGTPPLDAAQHLDVLNYLSDEGGWPVVPGTFGTPPPPRVVPVEQTVPDAAAGCRSAAAVAGRGKIAFRTRSEEEILDDGYKWRKYGKKSVKNSPNPRNYYRCSTEGCSVKKRIERDMNDPSYVVTTYEGIHNHASPGTVYYAVQDAASGRFFVSEMHHLGP